MDVRELRTLHNGRLAIWVAYPLIFILLAGDAVRYTLGWVGWGILLGLTAAVMVVTMRSWGPRILYWLHPGIAALLILMAISAFWSYYPGFTLLAVVSQVLTTLGGLFLIANFDWRALLRIFSNSLRVILAGSLVIELVSALTGPVAPLFKNYEGDVPPSPAFYWSQGHLFDGGRIQGIVGNANLLAFVALLALVTFAIEFRTSQRSRPLAIVFVILATGALVLADSAGMTVALVAILAIYALVRLGQRRPIENRSRFATVGMIWIVGLGGVAWFFRDQIFEMLGRSSDATGRLDTWEKVWGLITERPLQGWGWISHWVPGVAPYEGLVVIQNTPLYHAHNAFLDVWLQLGVVGFAIFCYVLFVTFRSNFRLALHRVDDMHLWPLLVLVLIGVQALSESRILIEIGWVLFAMLTARAHQIDVGAQMPRRRKSVWRQLYERFRPQPKASV